MEWLSIGTSDARSAAQGASLTRPMRSPMFPVAIGFTFVVVCAAYFVSSGTPLKDAVVVAALLSPLIAYLALVRPLVFPYALYICLMPFDMLVDISSAGTLAKIVGIVTGLFLLYYCLRVRRIVTPKLNLRIIGFFVVWMTISLLWTVDPQSAAVPMGSFLGLALLYAALTLTPITLPDFKFILIAIVAAYVIASVAGMVYFHEHPPQVDPIHNSRLVLQQGANHIDPNEYADALIFPITIVMMFALRSRWLTLKLAGFALVGVMVSGILLSASREAACAFVVVMAYFFWRSRYRVQLAVAGCAVILALVPFSVELISRFSTAVSTGGAGRTSIWAVGLEAAKHYGLFGSGIGTFPIVFNRFYLATPQTHLYGWDAPPHNVLLRYLVELGVIGLGLVVWFIVVNFTMLRTIQRDHPLYDYRVMIEGGLIGICTTAFFIDSFHDKWTWLVFATAAQLVYIASTYKLRTDAADEKAVVRRPVVYASAPRAALSSSHFANE